MNPLASSTTLDENENYSANDRDGVERQVHNVTDDGLGTELLEGTLDNFAQLLHRISSRPNLASLADNLGVSASEQGTVENIQ